MLEEVSSFKEADEGGEIVKRITLDCQTGDFLLENLVLLIPSQSFQDSHIVHKPLQGHSRTHL